MLSRRTYNWPLPGAVDPVIADLRRYEAEQVRDDKESERREQRIEREIEKLKLKRGDFDLAVREGFWRDSPDHAAAHIAYVNGDYAEFGRLMAKIIDKELRDMAKRLIDG